MWFGYHLKIRRAERAGEPAHQMVARTTPATRRKQSPALLLCRTRDAPRKRPRIAWKVQKVERSPYIIFITNLCK